jgi:hypothetical protein
MKIEKPMGNEVFNLIRDSPGQYGSIANGKSVEERVVSMITSGSFNDEKILMAVLGDHDLRQAVLTSEEVSKLIEVLNMVKARYSSKLAQESQGIIRIRMVSCRSVERLDHDTEDAEYEDDGPQDNDEPDRDIF